MKRPWHTDLGVEIYFRWGRRALQCVERKISKEMIPYKLLVIEYHPLLSPSFITLFYHPFFHPLLSPSFDAFLLTCLSFDVSLFMPLLTCLSFDMPCNASPLMPLLKRLSFHASLRIPLSFHASLGIPLLKRLSWHASLDMPHDMALFDAFMCDRVMTRHLHTWYV